MAYSAEFKREAVQFAVQRANEHGWPVSRSAKHMGISLAALFAWLKSEYTCEVEVTMTRRAKWVPRVEPPTDLPDAMREGGEGA